MPNHTFLATRPVGVYLAQELEGFGAQIVERPAGVSLEGGLALAYRACLWSCMVNRIILQLAVEANSDELYQATRQIDRTAHPQPLVLSGRFCRA